MTRPDIPVTITGNSKGLEAALARIRTNAKTTSDSVVSSFGRIKSRLGSAAEVFGTFMGGPGGLASALGIGTFVQVTQEAVGSVLDLGKAAKTAGVSFEAFQQLKFAAEQNRIGVDALTDGLKEMQLRADEFAKTGAGPAAESFQRIGMNAQAVAEALKKPDQMFETIIDRIGRLDKAAQIRVLDELFGGTAAEQFIAFLDKGAGKIGDLRKEATQLGLVLDEDVLTKAEDINREWDKLATLIGTRIKGSVVEVAGVMQGVLEKMQTFNTKLGEIGNSSVFKRIGEMVGLDMSKTFRVVPGQGIVEQGEKFGPTAPTGPRTTDTTGRLPSGTDILRQALIQQRIEAGFESSGTYKVSEASRSAAAKAVKDEDKAVEDVIASLKEEISLVGASDTEREKANQLRRAGVDATSAEGKQISSLVDQLYKQQEAEQQLADQRERAQEAAISFGQTLDDQLLRVVDGTFDAKDALASLVQELINAQTNGKGLFGSIFSAIAGGFSAPSASSLNSSIGFTGANTTLGGFLGYGGARAGGGDVTPGRIYRINEYEDEFFAPSTHGRVIAPSKLRGNDAAPETGRSVVEVRLGEGLVGEILQQSSDQSVELIRTNNVAQANYRQNGGTI